MAEKVTSIEPVFTRSEVEDFLYYEAALLDEWRLDDWLSLFTEDAVYIVPTTDLPDGDPSKDLVFINDDVVQLRGRVDRLKSRHAHREHPRSRTRRFISNVRITDCTAGVAVVEASFLVYRYRSGSTDPFVGQYSYQIIRADDQIRIKHRRATLDLETLRNHGAVSIII
ncbi:MAG TPA: aromatic-ring-hydroxylating dioxygenase subunit beta [Alphaproteobacteria bacterium]|nr:aromatic-ring-hydroxylating dioxygenase subunit beta [Alphaproteobacteria bacterium]